MYTHYTLHHIQGFFLDFGQGGQKRCNALLEGAKLYYIPESKANDKLGSQE